MTDNKTSYRDNPLLKKSGIEIRFTEEQVKEYIKCSEDILYFMKNYMKIINVDRGLIPFEMYPFQEEMVKTFENNRFTITKCPRQVGKCLQLYTPIVIRNKKTGEIRKITIGEFYEQQSKLLREKQGENPSSTTSET